MAETPPPRQEKNFTAWKNARAPGFSGVAAPLKDIRDEIHIILEIQ